MTLGDWCGDWRGMKHSLEPVIWTTITLKVHLNHCTTGHRTPSTDSITASQHHSITEWMLSATDKDARRYSRHGFAIRSWKDLLLPSTWCVYLPLPDLRLCSHTYNPRIPPRSPHLHSPLLYPFNRKIDLVLLPRLTQRLLRQIHGSTCIYICQGGQACASASHRVAAASQNNSLSKWRLYNNKTGNEGRIIILDKYLIKIIDKNIVDFY